MITITRRLEFDAGHRIMHHESKCATLHGHRYVVEIEATADVLDPLGRIIDFSVLKKNIGGWIDEHWDHTTLLCREDEKTIELISECPGFKKPFICDFNPTAENVAEYLLKEVCPLMMYSTGITITKIALWETPNCRAEATL